MKKTAALFFFAIFICMKGLPQPFSENFETAPFQFSVPAPFTAVQNTTYYQEGTNSLHLTTSSVNAQGTLTMNSAIDLTKLSSPKLSFYHICATEPVSDFGMVQYSNNGGAWTPFPTSAYKGQGTLKNGVVGFDASSYTDWEAQFKDVTSTPGTGTGGAFWKQEIVDLSLFKNSPNFKIRFVYTTDAANNYYGWLIDRVAILSATALSGIYTINNTVATSGVNYNNFRDAITDLNIKGVSSSVTFTVTSGQTFAEDAPSVFATGTTATAIQFIKSGAGNNPVIKPTGGASTIDAGITVWGGDYLTFNGIDITEASGSAVEYGYYIVSASKTDGAQNNTIKNTSITLNRANTKSFGIYQYAKYDPTHVSTDANNYNKYYNLTIKNVYGGIYLQGYSSSNYDIGCEVGNILSSTAFNSIGDSKTAKDIGGSGTGAYGVGIRAKNQNNIKIYNNEVSNVHTTGSDSKAIGIFLENSSGGSFAYNNKVHDITTTSTATSLPATVTGIRADVNTNETATIYNNFVYSLTHSINGSTTTATPVLQGIAANVGSTKGIVNVYHNSVNIAVSNTNATCASFYTASGTSVVKNNVFSNLSTSNLSTSKRYAFYYYSGTLVSDYNNLYVASGTNNFVGYYNTDLFTLANWKSVAGGDASSRNENPPFASATDLHIPNGTFTELESSGTPVSVTNINSDIDAQVRPGPTVSINGGGTAPDIGADEFDGKPVPLMTYRNSLATQTSARACAGVQNVRIISMQVVVTNTALPLTLTNLIINSNGTTSLSNTVASYQVYYTGNNNTFGAGNPVNNATVLNPGDNTVIPISTVTLSTGNNYFWLVYNLKTTATGSLDAQFNSITVTSGSTPTTFIPSTPDPEGAILVYKPPVAIDPAVTTVCFGTPVTLTASGADTYSWAPDAELSAATGTTVVATPSTTTTYTVTATDASTGCTATGTSVITITPLSKASFTTSSPFATCVNQNVSLALTGTPNTSVGYQMNGDGNYTASISADGTGTITTNNLQTGTNTYNLKAVSAGSGTCATNINSKATVNAQPLPVVSSIIVPEGGAYVQTNSTLQLSNPTTGGVWSGNNVSQATVDNTGKVTGVSAGVLGITYTVTDNNSLHCQNMATQTVRVYNPDYVTKTTSGNFSDPNNWLINRGDNTYIPAPSAPSATNTNYTSIAIQHPMILDQSFQVGESKSFTFAGGGTMEINPNITFSSAGTVDFGGRNVTVKSDATGTGAIGQMATAIQNATNVTVERYIPLTTTNGSAGRTGRAWRLITSPITDATIQQSWQEGKTWTGGATEPTAGLGTIITGEGTPGVMSSAFDYIPASAHHSSIRQYTPGTISGSWDVLSTNATAGTNILIRSQPAWMVFVRGDRTANTSTAAGTTTLRTTGSLNQGIQNTITIPGTHAYTLVGNPYASPINFEVIYNASHISKQFLTWNSKNGVYGSYTLIIRNGANDYSVIPNAFRGGTGTSSSNAQYIMSGEGFLVQPAVPGTDGTLSIGEAVKTSSASVGINPYRLSPSTEQKLYVNLNLVGSDSTATLADGIMERFDALYSAQIDGDDAPKQTNFNENLGIESGAADLIVEARPPVQQTDTVQLKLWNVTARVYELQVKGDNYAQAAAAGLHAYLEDSYLKTKTEVSLMGTVTTLPFTVTGDAASYDLHRFRLVFQSDATILPLTLTQVKAVEQNNRVKVSWTVQNEVSTKDYVVERSMDGGTTFSTLAVQKARNSGAATGAVLTSYALFDASPHTGDNLYRIRVEGVDGRVTYSVVVKVTIGEYGSRRTLITLYPNPVSRSLGKTTLVFSHVKAGDYLVSVYSQGGQSVVEKKITVVVGAEAKTESVPLSSSLAGGTYELRLTDQNGTIIFKDHIIVEN